MATKFYSEITDADLTAIDLAWDGEGSFARHVNIWLADNGFVWDPELSDEANRADFYEIVAAAGRKADVR